jgi:hypothetical protein
LKTLQLKLSATQIALAIGAVLLASATQTSAVPGTKIAVACPNIVIWWPSTQGQSFLIEARPDLNPGTQWTQITNYFLAATGTNQTTFVHSNQIQCALAGSSDGGGGDAPLAASSVVTAMSLAHQWLGPLAMPADGSGDPEPLTMYPLGTDLSRLVILDPSTGQWVSGADYTVPLSALTGQQLDGSQPLDGPDPDWPDPPGGGSSGINMGFYRVINVTPVARDDIFGVEEYSSANQLDILKNDSDPNDDRFLISAVSNAGHGGVQYTPDASTFQYTPDSGFWGIDSFTYTITNLHGSFAAAKVTVFVNESGNQPPSEADVSITLQTNVYTAAFNALTNSSDPDSDPITLFAVGPTRLGSISTNSGGDVTYTRNPNFFGSETFTYVVTDGNGGYAIGNVAVSQVDSDGDGMPDEWEVRNGLDPMTDDSTADPDNDGLPNLAEYMLHTNPHHPDNPLYLGLTNGAVLSGFAQIPLPAIDPVIVPQPIVLYVNGTPAAKSFLSHGPDGEWFLNWNTVFLTNGTYSLKPAFQYAPEIAGGILFGPTVSVQVTNSMRFDQLTSEFSDFLVIDATLAVQRASVRVDLYDDYDSPLVYGTFSTTNGQILLAWDLTDGQGNQISFGNIHAKFVVTPDGGSAGSNIFEWFVKGFYSGGNTFVSAWGWDSYTLSFDNKTEQMMLNSVLNILGDPSNPNAYSLAPSANVAYGSAFRFDNSTDKQVLLDALSQANNFFWVGHGSYNGILGNRDRSDIGPTDIERVLQNFAFESRPNHPKEDKHEYRLVILNGCETYSSIWAGVFGIPFSSETSTNTVLDYQYTGQGPRAFVGWDDVIKIPFGWDPFGIGHAQYGEALGELFSDWMSGYPLDFCVDSFADRALSYGYTGNDTWRISGCTDLTRF